MFDFGTSPTGEHLNKRGRLRPDMEPAWAPAGFAPGQLVHVRYWRHEYDPCSRGFRALYIIAKSQNLEKHIQDGEFSCVYNAALIDLTTH